jgi:hypothetical protein
MNKTFSSHTKSSQVDFLFFFYDEHSVAIFHPELRTKLVAPLIFKITPLHGPHGKHRLPLLWMHVYSCVAWQQTSYSSMLLLGADRIENTIFLSIVASIRVFKVVAWQRVDQIRYSMKWKKH